MKAATPQRNSHRNLASALQVYSLVRCPLLVAPEQDGVGEWTAQPNPNSASPSGQHVLLGLRFQELSWDHTSPEEEESVLWLEFDGDNEGTPVNKLLKIYSKQVVGVAYMGVGMG